jgi:hypothetical protein
LLKFFSKELENVCQSSKTKVLNFKFGTLIVACRSSIYIVELTQMKIEMMQRINKVVGENVVKDIRFVLGEKKQKKPQKKKYRIINSIGVWLRNLFKKAS